MKEEKKYTVKDLIKALEKLDGNLTVLHEGCDCYGRWNGEIETNEIDDDILIKRYF